MTAKKHFIALCQMAGLDPEKVKQKPSAGSRGGKQFSNILRVLIQIGNYSFNDLSFLGITRRTFCTCKGGNVRTYKRNGVPVPKKENPYEYEAFVALYKSEIDEIFKK